MNVEITNMVMIIDKDSGKVLAQERIKRDWKGLSLPGGHVERGESFYSAAAREVLEETGLSVTNLKSCGVIHFVNTDNDDRYLIFCYKTDCYTGEPLFATQEGRNIWMSVEELLEAPSANLLPEILRIFLNDMYSECLGTWNNGGNWAIHAYI